MGIGADYMWQSESIVLDSIPSFFFSSSEFLYSLNVSSLHIIYIHIK